MERCFVLGWRRCRAGTPLLMHGQNLILFGACLWHFVFKLAKAASVRHTKIGHLERAHGAECRQIGVRGCDRCAGEPFAISALRSERWQRTERRGTAPSGRPLSVSAQGMHAQGIPGRTPYARAHLRLVFFLRLRRPQPLYPARPQKTSWAGQISPCRVPSNRSSWMRPMRRRAFCDFGLAVRTMAANGAKGNSTIRSAPLGECSGNACSGNPRAYAVRSCAPEACFFSSTTSPPTPVPCSPSKNLVGWPDFTVQSAVKSEFVDATDCAGEPFAISALRSERWQRTERRGTAPSGRPLSVSAQGMHAQGIPGRTPYARAHLRLVFFLRLRRPQPLYPARPQKTSWAGQISPCRVPSNRSSWMRPIAQASLLRFRPCGQNDGSERSEGEQHHQVGPSR